MSLPRPRASPRRTPARARLGPCGARLLPVLAVIVPLLGLLAYGFTRDPRDIPSSLIGKPAPPFTLTLFDGGTVSLAALRGKVVLLNFWASWCIPCRREARALEAGWRAYRDRGAVFVGVDIQDREADALAFLREFGVTYSNGPDPGSRIAIDYGVYGIPETFIIDREGRITYKHIGALGRETMTAKLEEAVRGVVSAGEDRGEFRSIR